MNRRGFLMGLSGLVAAAAVAVPTLALTKAPPPNDWARFMKLAATGRVSGQSFKLDRPIYLEGCRGLTIENCRFQIQVPPDGFAMVICTDSNNVTIRNCTFDTVEGTWGES